MRFISTLCTAARQLRSLGPPNGGLSHAICRTLGGHIKPGDKSMALYSRDLLAHPLRELDVVIDAIGGGRFRPDASRSGWWSTGPTRGRPRGLSLTAVQESCMQTMAMVQWLVGCRCLGTLSSSHSVGCAGRCGAGDASGESHLVRCIAAYK